MVVYKIPLPLSFVLDIVILYVSVVCVIQLVLGSECEIYQYLKLAVSQDSNH